MFCKKCGVIGHKATRCPISMEEAIRNFGARMAEVCLSHQNLLVGQPHSPCFTNNFIGLRRIEVLRTTRIDLTVPPSDEIPFEASFLNSPSQSNSTSSSDKPNEGGCSGIKKRKKPERSSSSSDDGSQSKKKDPSGKEGILSPYRP